MKKNVKRPIIIQPDDKSVRLIPLTQGQVALVDIADYDWLMQWTWCAHWNEKAKSFYAETAILFDRYRTVKMHRLILGLDFGDSRVGDHISGNTLDYRRSNLRVAEKLQNCQNRRKRHCRNTSGFKGVSPQGGKWKAQIEYNRKKKHLGLFRTPEEAYSAYCEAAKEFHGEFASF